MELYSFMNTKFLIVRALVLLINSPICHHLLCVSFLRNYDCLQVMYAFVMRPETLPKAYQDFIQKTGPVAQPVYKAVRDCCRGFPVDVASLSAFLSDKKNSNHAKLEEFPSIIPCSIIHPDTSSCLAHNANATSATFRKTFPLYFSLTFVPFVVLHLQKVDSFLISVHMAFNFPPSTHLFRKTK